MTMPLLGGGEIPLYQLELLKFLEGFKYTQGLQDICRRYKFTEEEARRYRENWGKWLKPKSDVREANHARNLG